MQQLKHLALFIWNVALAVCTAVTSGTGGLALGLQGTASAIDVLDIIHSFDHDKSSSIHS